MGDTFDKVKKGFKQVAGGVKEGVEETAEGTKEGVEKVTDSDTYTGTEGERRNRDYNEAGGKEPMNPDDIASHEPTAVKREKSQGTSGDPI